LKNLGGDSMALFSIVIATRNRADLLKYAIQSVLAQDCNDYELIISDNNSSDNTYDVVKEFNNSKIRYVNTENFLVAYESWNFAYRQAKGDYILGIGDDDFLVPTTLTEVKKVIQETSALVIAYRIIGYYDNSFYDPVMRNTIVTEKFTGRTFKIDMKEVINAYFGGQKPGYPPHPSAVVVSRKIANEIADEFGNFFLCAFSEMIFIPLAVVKSKFLFVVDNPLVVVGRGSRSQVAREVYDPDKMWENEGVNFQMTLFKGKYSINAHIEALLRLKHLDPEHFKDCEIPLEKYCCLYYQAMLNASRVGRDTSADLKEFYQKLSTLPSNVQQNVRGYIRKAEIKEFLRISPLWKIAAVRTLIKVSISMLNSIFKKGNTVFIRGDRIDIHNIAECAEKLEDIKTKFNLINNQKSTQNKGELGSKEIK
jgi:glycosyltransferase involved in cell wall biosynthesis